jgi:hypothetical protein
MMFISLLTILRLLHLCGLIMGIGGAFMADATIFYYGVFKRVNEYTIFQAEILSRLVTVGLVILWTTGFGLIWIDTIAKPEFITNPKLWAKVAIVVALTVNGYIVHKKILPLLKASVGKGLFDELKPRAIWGIALVGAVSTVSWIFPFVLGKASELNYVVPAWEILVSWAMALLVTWLALGAIIRLVNKFHDYVHRVASQIARTPFT